MLSIASKAKLYVAMFHASLHETKRGQWFWYKKIKYVK